MVNVHNKSSTFRVYDSTDTLGNLQPIPKGAKNKQACGGAGQILVALVAAAVTFWITKSFNLAGKILSAFGTSASAAAPLAVAAANAAAGAIAGAAGSVAGQGVGVLTGIQDRIDWRGVGLSAISGAVSGYMGPSQSGGFIAGLERGVAANVVTQTIGVAVGLQKKFDWAGVAAAGLQGGVSTLVANSSWLATNVPASANPLSPASLLNAAIPGVAGAVASAAAQSALTRTDFGDNLRALLPDVIGSTIGNALAAKAVMNAADLQAVQSQVEDPLSDGFKDAAQISDPWVKSVEGLATRDGVPAYGRFAFGDDPNDPGAISLDAQLLDEARTSPLAAAQVLAARMEEGGHAYVRAMSSRSGDSGPNLDAGAVYGGLAFARIASSVSGDYAFTLQIDGEQRRFATNRASLDAVFERTFTPERIFANTHDLGGTYQTKEGRPAYAQALADRKAETRAAQAYADKAGRAQTDMLLSRNYLLQYSQGNAMVAEANAAMLVAGRMQLLEGIKARLDTKIGVRATDALDFIVSSALSLGGVYGSAKGGGSGAVAVKGVRAAESATVQSFNRARITKGFQDHHIVSDKNPLTVNHELLDLSGYNLQSRSNRMFLPESGAAHPTRSIHQGRHLNSVSQNLADRMDAVVRVGRDRGWNQAQYRQAMDAMVSQERVLLRSGERALNKNVR